MSLSFNRTAAVALKDACPGPIWRLERLKPRTSRPIPALDRPAGTRGELPGAGQNERNTGVERGLNFGKTANTFASNRPSRTMTLAQRILIRAIEKAGSTERLAQLLGIAPESLNGYVDGDRAIPERLAHALADVVFDER